jgi:hypothetical protein
MRKIGIYLRLQAKSLIRDNIIKFLFHAPENQLTSPLLSENHHIVTPWEVVLMQSIEFPDEPLDLVPYYRIPYLFADGYPQSVQAQPVLLKNKGEVGCAASLARPI